MTILIADAFDFPMGTAMERRQLNIPPGLWHIALEYGMYYSLGYHTGIDTTIEPGGGRGEKIHAVANGEITYAQRMALPGYTAWGNLIIQRCYLPGWIETSPHDNLMYIRYAHSDPLFVKVGDHVIRGQVLSLESDAFGVYYPHLHLDFSPTAILYLHPEHWPGMVYQSVLDNYIEPLSYIRRHRPMTNELDQIDAHADQIKELTAVLRAGGTPPPPTTWTGVVITNTLNVRDQPSTSGNVIKQLVKNDPIQVSIKQGDVVSSNGYKWTPVINPIFSVKAFVAGDLLGIPNL